MLCPRACWVMKLCFATEGLATSLLAWKNNIALIFKKVNILYFVYIFSLEK